MEQNKENSSIPKITKVGDKVHVEGLGEFDSTHPYTLRLYAESLQISYEMIDLSDKENPKPPVFVKFIHGDAVIYGDLGLGVIGYEDTYTNKLKITIRRENKDEIRDLNQRLAKKREDQLILNDAHDKKVFDFSGSEKLYTSALLDFSPANWELGTKSNYFLSVCLMEEFFDFIAEKIESKSIERIKLGVDTEGLYTKDKFAFASRPIRFNFLPNQRDPSLLDFSDMRAPDSVNGYVSEISIFENKRILSGLASLEEDGALVESSEGEDEDSLNLKQILLRFDDINKTNKSIRVAVWIAVFMIAILCMGNL